MCYYKDMMLGFLQLQFDKNSKVLTLLTALLKQGVDSLKLLHDLQHRLSTVP